MLEGESRKRVRSLLGLGIYRTALFYGVMVGAVRAFPDHRLLAAYSIVFVSLAVGGIGDLLSGIALDQSRVADMAERKTRHTIILAQQWALVDQTADGWEFWNEVDRRVSDEAGEADAAPHWAAAAALIAVNVAWRVGSDLLAVVIVLTLNPPT